MRETATSEIPDWVYNALLCTVPYRNFFVTKGIGSGGTYGAVIWHLAMCAINSRSPRSWFIAPTFSQIHDPVLPMFAEILQTKFGMREGRDFSIRVGNQPKLVLRYSNQVIAFKSANKPASLVAASLSHITGTELPFWEKQSYERALQRVRCKLAVRPQALFEFAPEGSDNWASQLCDWPAGVREDLNMERIVLWTQDNKYLPAGFIEKLTAMYGYDQDRLRAYLFGEITKFSKSTAYWEFAEHRALQPTHPAKVFPLRISWDFNLSPIAWVALQKQPHITYNKHYFKYPALAEASGKSRGLLDACAEVVATFPPQYWSETPIEIDGDPAGHAGEVTSGSNPYRIIMDYLRQFYPDVRLVAKRAAPRIQARLERTNQLLAYQRAPIDPSCENLRKSARDTQLKKGQWEIVKPPGEVHTHFGDAWSYGVYNLSEGDNLDGKHTIIRGLNR